MRSEKQQMMKGIELTNQEKIRMLGANEIDNYMGILEVESIKQLEIKRKN